MKIKDGFKLQPFADRWVAVSQDGKIISLNGVGGFLWQKLQSEQSEEKLVEYVMEKYNVDQKTARNDVLSFLQKLKDNKLAE